EGRGPQGTARGGVAAPCLLLRLARGRGTDRSRLGGRRLAAVSARQRDPALLLLCEHHLDKVADGVLGEGRAAKQPLAASESERARGDLPRAVPERGQ